MANVKQLNTKNQYGDFEGLPELHLVKVANGLYYIADEYRNSVAVVKRPQNSKTWSIYYWELQKDGSVDKIFWQDGKTAKSVISSFMRAVAGGIKYYPEPGQELPLGATSLYADQEAKIASNQSDSDQSDQSDSDQSSDIEGINTSSSKMTRVKAVNVSGLYHVLNDKHDVVSEFIKEGESWYIYYCATSDGMTMTYRLTEAHETVDKCTNVWIDLVSSGISFVPFPYDSVTRQESDKLTELGGVCAVLGIDKTTSFEIRKLQNDPDPYVRYGVYQKNDQGISVIPETKKASEKDAIIAAYNLGIYYHTDRVRNDIISGVADSFDASYVFCRKAIAFSESNPGVMFWKAEDLLGTLRVFGFSEPEEFDQEPVKPELGVWVEDELFSNLLRVTEDVTINIHQGSYGKYAVYVNEGGNSRLDVQANTIEDATAQADKTATLIHYTNLAGIKSELYGIAIDRKDGKTAKYTDEKRQSIQKALMEFLEFSRNIKGRDMSEWLNDRLEYCFEMVLYIRAYDNELTPSDVARLSI